MLDIPSTAELRLALRDLLSSEVAADCPATLGRASGYRRPKVHCDSTTGVDWCDKMVLSDIRNTDGAQQIAALF